MPQRESCKNLQVLHRDLRTFPPSLLSLPKDHGVLQVFACLTDAAFDSRMRLSIGRLIDLVGFVLLPRRQSARGHFAALALRDRETGYFRYRVLKPQIALAGECRLSRPKRPEQVEQAFQACVQEAALKSGFSPQGQRLQRSTLAS